MGQNGFSSRFRKTSTHRVPNSSPPYNLFLKIFPTHTSLKTALPLINFGGFATSVTRPRLQNFFLYHN